MDDRQLPHQPVVQVRRVYEMRRLAFFVLTCGVLAAASPAFAQATQQAELRVTVIDQTGGSIPMARVRITRADGTIAEAVVNDRGQTTIGGLPVANVQLYVEA